MRAIDKYFDVKIVKCSEEGSWYEDRIGETYTVKEEYNDYYYFRIDDRSYIILKTDCEIVNNTRGIVSKPGVSGAFTGDNRVDSLRRIQTMCQSERDDSQELLKFKLNVLHTVINGLYY